MSEKIVIKISLLNAHAHSVSWINFHYNYYEKKLKIALLWIKWIISNKKNTKLVLVKAGMETSQIRKKSQNNKKKKINSSNSQERRSSEERINHFLVLA